MAYILFADDEDHIQDAVEPLRAPLAARGHRFVTVRDGGEALRIVREDPPDILVTDTVMRFTDGFELISALKKLRPGPESAAILLTVFGATGEPAWYETDTIDAYAVKPFNPWQIYLEIQILAARL